MSSPDRFGPDRFGAARFGADGSGGERVGALDAVDAALVRELQRDGRLSYQELAERTGVSREAARTRVQRLLARGRVRIVGIVAPQVAGLAAMAHVSLDVGGPSGPVARVAAGRAAARFVSCTAGARGVVVDLRAADEDALDRELAVLRSAPGVRDVEVFRCAELVKDAYSPLWPDGRRRPGGGPVSTGLTAADLDAVDRRLLALLQEDGRAAFAALAQEVGLSGPAVRARVLRLLDSGAVHVTALIATRALGVREAAGIGLGVGYGGGYGNVHQVAREVSAVPGVNFVARGHGRFDLVCGVDARDREELLVGLEAVRSVAGVARSESWVHMEIVKESYSYDLPTQ
ncbi:DNA-binding Lrp family transcriptional regulator [Streptacidiphilus sp. MAP12-20]|uniref:Lrp/AsnC family transcriptional regulator n=1 Tax=Streptacidiphilus sp. MAP12-20 TaxID=3156299 RepID=UPI003516026A